MIFYYKGASKRGQGGSESFLKLNLKNRGFSFTGLQMLDEQDLDSIRNKICTQP